MSGAKEYDYAFQQAKAQVTPDEIDQYISYTVVNPSLSATYIGTVAGTQTASAALVLTSIKPDYPRNLLYGIVGTADIGGSITVVGKNQFGEVITETVGSGTAAAGTPAFAIAGTKIFAEVTAGTVTFATSAGQGNGTARVGLAIGTAGTALFRLGLPTKIGAVSDVKRITWTSQHLGTAINGGTIGTAQIDVDNHAYLGQTIMAGTEVFQFTIKPTFDNSSKPRMTNL